MIIIIIIIVIIVVVVVVGTEVSFFLAWLICRRPVELQLEGE